jgi:hypothetical protein
MNKFQDTRWTWGVVKKRIRAASYYYFYWQYFHYFRWLIPLSYIYIMYLAIYIYTHYVMFFLYTYFMNDSANKRYILNKNSLYDLFSKK